MSSSRALGGFLSLFRPGTAKPAMTRDTGPLALRRRSGKDAARDPGPDESQNRLIFAAQTGELAPVLEALLPPAARAHQFPLDEALRLAQDAQMTIYDAILEGLEVEGLPAEALDGFVDRRIAAAMRQVREEALKQAQVPTQVRHERRMPAPPASNVAHPKTPFPKTAQQNQAKSSGGDDQVLTMEQLLAAESNKPIDPSLFGATTSTFERRARRKDI